MARMSAARLEIEVGKDTEEFEQQLLDTAHRLDFVGGALLNLAVTEQADHWHISSSGAKIYCPKCNGRNIKHERKEPSPDAISMDDLAIYNPIQVIPLVLRTFTWRATCNDCGYFVHYESH